MQAFWRRGYTGEKLCRRGREEVCRRRGWVWFGGGEHVGYAYTLLVSGRSFLCSGLGDSGFARQHYWIVQEVHTYVHTSRLTA